jgi:hypothetical protein
VAAVWTWFIARVLGISLPWCALAAMFVAVWVLYAADRLLDARVAGAELEERHLFHHRHRVGFRWGIAAGCAVLAGLLPTMMAAEVRLYVVLGALLVGWFVVIHTGARPLPKEFVVGIFFAAAVFIPAVAREPRLRHELLLPAVLLGVLCSLNCLFIFAWEHEGRGSHGAHRSTKMAAQGVVWVACGVVAAAVFFFRSSEIAVAVGLSAGLLVVLHLLRGRVERTTLRGLADLALLTPLVVGMWVR